MKKALGLLLLASCATTAQAFDTTKLDAFADDVAARHGLDRAWVNAVLSSAEKKQSILDAMSRPAERTKAWHEYRTLFINEQRIRDGVKFYEQHRATLERIAAECGVPERIIVAILGIETQYGTRTGSYRVIDALSTLAFAYPPRSEFFRSELEQFLLLTREHEVDPFAATGSYAGAMGAPQFISSSYRRYAVDASGDGRIDLWGDWRDVIGSVANYLHTFGWRAGEPITEPLVGSGDAASLVGERLELNLTARDLRDRAIELDAEVPADLRAMVFELEHDDGPRLHIGYENFYVITRYNRSRMYAMAVVDLGDEIARRVEAP